MADAEAGQGYGRVCYRDYGGNRRKQNGKKTRSHQRRFFPKKPDWPAQYPSVVIAVDDIKDAMKKVTDAGGKILGEPMEIPGIGHYVSFTDTEGNRLSMLEPLPMRSKPD